MPKIVKEFATSEITIYQDGTYLPYDAYTHSDGTQKSFPFGRTVPNYTKGVQTNPHIVFNRLQKCIETGNFAEFENILKRDFIYGMIGSRREVLEHPHPDVPNNVRQIYTTFKKYHVRPTVEALFAEHNALFCQLIDSLIARNDEALFAAFRRSLANTELANEALFEWNKDIQLTLFAQIEDLQSHADKLIGDNDDLSSPIKIAAPNSESDQITTLVIDLDNSVRNRNLDVKDTNQEKFSNLQFKLQLVNDLHKRDADFANHYDLKRFAKNFAVTLFSVGIANLINWCTSGNFLFFQKSGTQKRISNFQAAIGFDPNTEIRGKKPAM